MNTKTAVESSPRRENSMVQSEDIHNNGQLATAMFQRMTLQENTESPYQTVSTSTAGPLVSVDTTSLEYRRAMAYDLANCFCQIPHLRDIEYEIAEQLEWYRSNDDPYYSSLDYDALRAPEYIPEYQPEHEGRYRPELEGQHQSEYQQDLESRYHPDFETHYQPERDGRFQPGYVEQYLPECEIRYRSENVSGGPDGNLAARRLAGEHEDGEVPEAGRGGNEPVGIQAILQMFEDESEPSDENNNSF